MREEDKIKEKYGQTTGFKVPEDYFKQLNERILEQLPEYPEAPKTIELSRWQRLKPYFYLAAMFCGIWIMMKVFHVMSTEPVYSFDNPPVEIAEIIDDEGFDYYAYYDSDSSSEPEYILEEEVIEGYDSFSDFQKDFGYDLKPEYSSLSYNFTGYPSLDDSLRLMS